MTKIQILLAELAMNNGSLLFDTEYDHCSSCGAVGLGAQSVTHNPGCIVRRALESLEADPANAVVTITSIWSKQNAYDFPATYPVVVMNGPVDDMLEEAFYLTNADDRPFGNKVCSTSAGDMMEIDGAHYLVAGAGFDKISPEQYATFSKLTSRDTSMGLAWLIKNKGCLLHDPHCHI